MHRLAPRTHRTLIVAVAVVAAGALLAPLSAAGAAPPRAEPVPPTQLQSLTVTPTSLSVVGLKTATVTVTAVIRSAGGVITWNNEPGTPYYNRVLATFRHVGAVPVGVPSTWTMVLALTSGTSQQGTWTGTWRVGSAWRGRWVLDHLYAGTEPTVANDPTDWRVSPAAVGMPRSVVVVGISPPRLSITRTPALATYPRNQTVRFRFTNARGTALAGRPIMTGSVEWCGPYGIGGATRVLSRFGSTATTLRLADPPNGSNPAGITYDIGDRATLPRMSVSTGDLCVYLTEPTGNVDAFGVSGGTPPVGGVLLGARATHLWRFTTVTSAPSRLASGRLAVTGTVAPALDWVAPTATLQRLVGRSWRTVATVAVSNSGRYRITTAAGPGRYRVLARSTSPEFAPTAGTVFRVRS